MPRPQPRLRGHKQSGNFKRPAYGKWNIFNNHSFVKTARLFNGGDSSDIDEVIDYLYLKYCVDANGNQIKSITAVGNSLGASMLANYAARKGDECPLDALVGICCHFNTRVAFKNIQTAWGGFYDYLLGVAFYYRNKQSFIEFDSMTKGTKVLPLFGKAWSLTRDVV